MVWGGFIDIKDFYGVIICGICKGDHINSTDIGVLTSLFPQHYDDPEQVKSLNARGKFIAAGALHCTSHPCPGCRMFPQLYIFMKCLNEIVFYIDFTLISLTIKGCVRLSVCVSRHVVS